MRRFFVSMLGCAVMMAAMGITAQETVAQNTAPLDRGAVGNGSMGMGDGIPDPANSRGVDDTEENSRWLDRQNPDAKGEPGHGGNETDMEHHRRPRLGNDRAD